MQDLHGYYLEDLEVGMTASFAKTISEADVYGFAGISGDTNPIHINDEYAKTTVFGQRIAHGMLSGALISTVAGTKLPGPGAIYIDQSIKFKAPLFIGQTARAEIEVKEINTKRARVVCETRVCVGDKVIALGQATFMVDRRPEV